MNQLNRIPDRKLLSETFELISPGQSLAVFGAQAVLSALAWAFVFFVVRSHSAHGVWCIIDSALGGIVMLFAAKVTLDLFDHSKRYVARRMKGTRIPAGSEILIATVVGATPAFVAFRVCMSVFGP